MSTPLIDFADVVARYDKIDDPYRPGRTLDLLARMIDLGDAVIAERSGMSRASVNAKRCGRRIVRTEDLWPLASALGIPLDYLLMRPDEAGKALLSDRAATFRCNSGGGRQLCGAGAGTSTSE